jgi:hypothetical protein
MLSRTFSIAEMQRRYALVHGMMDAQELEAVIVFPTIEWGGYELGRTVAGRLASLGLLAAG